MARKALAPATALVSDSVEETGTAASIIYRECDPPDQCLFQGKDEVGREGCFLRLEVTGMYTRRCGPFETREEALDTLDVFASKVDEGFIDVMNDLRMPKELSRTEVGG